MKKKQAKPKAKKSPEQTVALKQWDELLEMIQNYKDAAIVDSWKGGGDPADVPIAETAFQLASLQLSVHIERMKAYYEN